jgi:hypothetical protein
MIKKVPTINIDWMRNIVPKNDWKKKIVPKNYCTNKKVPKNID